jgi:MFS family permease
MEEDLDRGWFVVVAALWVIAITSGSFYSYGVFFKPMAAEFGWNRQLTSGVMGLACLIYVVVLPFAGHLADRQGSRLVMAASTGLLGLGYVLGAYVQSAFQLYLFVGVLGGLSYPGLLPVPVAVVSRWFKKNRGLALGIALAGVGAGTLIIPALTSLLFGLRAIGAIFATISIAEGIGLGVGSFLAGYIWDATGGYALMFHLGVALILAAMTLPLFVKAPQEDS